MPELLRSHLGAQLDLRTPRDPARLSLDEDSPGWVLSGPEERTGTDGQGLHRMTIAQLVPWLLDDVRPDDGTDALTTYVACRTGGLA